MSACTECSRPLRPWQRPVPTRDAAEIERLRQIGFADEGIEPPCTRCGRKLEAGQSPEPPKGSPPARRQARCKGCGATFTTPVPTGRKPAYCSADCRLSRF